MRGKKIITGGLVGLCLVLATLFTVWDAFPNWATWLYLITTGALIVIWMPPIAQIQRIVHAKRSELIHAGVLFVVALAVLSFKLTTVTPGMWGDEVALGWMVEELRHLGSFTPFIEHNLGHPTPLIYLSMIPISILGRTMVALRIVSVVFGALSVSAFYILLRRFFEKYTALSGAAIFGSSYVLLIVSRFAYEMSAGIFFLILSILFLVLLARVQSPTRIRLLGLSLGAGLYTYLGFRSVIPVFVLAVIAIVWKKKKRALSLLGQLLVAFLLLTLPLFSFSVRHPEIVNQRVSSLSVFHQGLPTSEVLQELRGASFRTLTLFFISPDPNPRQNPAESLMFDLATTALFFGGLGYLLYKKRRAGVFVFAVLAVIFIAEIVTLERIPEGHYYGLGHPNTLRISLALPMIVFGATAGLALIQKKLPQDFRLMVLETSTLGIVIMNLHLYFNQPPNQWTHMTNFVVPLQIIEGLHAERPNQVALSKSLYELEHIKYFLDSDIERFELPSPIDCAQPELPAMTTVIWALDLKECTIEQLQQASETPGYDFTFISNQWNILDGVVIIPSDAQ